MLKRLFRQMTGFKWTRVGEWRAVVMSEAKRLGWASVAIELGRGALGLGGVNRARWRRRLRACRGCPVYDRKRRACRDTAGQGTGCGCWMPAKALVAGPCWIRGLGVAKYGFD